MREELTGVLGNRRIVFSDTNTTRSVADDPRTDDRIHRVFLCSEVRQQVKLLNDMTFLAVLSFSLQRSSVTGMHFDVGTFARVERLLHVVGGEASRLEARGVRHIYLDGGATIQRFLAAGLAAAMQRMIDSPEELRACKRRSAEAGANVWDWSRFAPRLVATLASALAPRDAA